MPRLDHQIVKKVQWYWSSSSNKVLEASGVSHQPCGSPCNGGINKYKFESNLKPKKCRNSGTNECLRRIT